jgi:hypothetical protein
MMAKVATRTKTAREILDEYERLAREREEKRFNQITNANVSDKYLADPIVIIIIDMNIRRVQYKCQ